MTPRAHHNTSKLIGLIIFIVPLLIATSFLNLKMDDEYFFIWAIISFVLAGVGIFTFKHKIKALCPKCDSEVSLNKKNYYECLQAKCDFIYRPDVSKDNPL